MDQNVFAEQLKIAMDAAGMKQADLIHAAQEEGHILWKSQVSLYVSGKTIPRPDGYDPAEFAAACQTAAGQPIPAEAMLNYGRLPNGKYMLNWPVNGNDVYMNIVEVPYARRDAALRPAREKTLRFIYYIQHELGFSHLGIADDEFGTADGLAYLPYHREGRRLDGVIRLTLDDVADRYGRPSALYRTGISVGDNPVDHPPDSRPQLGKQPFPPEP